MRPQNWVSASMLVLLLVGCLLGRAPSAIAADVATVVEPAIDLRLYPDQGSPIKSRVYAGQQVELLAERRLDARHLEQWNRIVVIEPPTVPSGEPDTLWAPSAALLRNRSEDVMSLRTDLSLYEVRPGVFGRRMGPGEFLSNSRGVRDSSWVSATFGTTDSGEPFSVTANVYKPGRYFNFAKFQGKELEREDRKYDSLYASGGYRLIAELESNELIRSVRFRVLIARRVSTGDGCEENGYRFLGVEGIVLSDTTLAVNGYFAQLTCGLSSKSLWEPLRQGHATGLTVLTVADVELLAPGPKRKLAQRMLFRWASCL